MVQVGEIIMKIIKYHLEPVRHFNHKKILVSKRPCGRNTRKRSLNFQLILPNERSKYNGNLLSEYI